MSKENKSRYALLGMLTFGPMSGYDLKKMTDFSINHFWQENYAQIYPMLKQLTQEGLTTSQMEIQEGKPNRRIYTLTDKGREELQRWLACPIEYQVIRNELLLKLFFAKEVPISTAIQHLKEVRERQIQYLHVLQETKGRIKEMDTENQKLPYWLITLSNGRHHAQASLDWCDETLATLEKMTPTKEQETTLN